ncbi:3574_t:CDS:10, partial [Ambispora gerdemannii]
MFLTRIKHIFSQPFFQRAISSPPFATIFVKQISNTTISSTKTRPHTFNINNSNTTLITRYYASESQNTDKPKKKEIRARRALFYVPGSEERKISRSRTTPADCIVYDLEDGVAFNRKGIAREMVFDTLEASVPELSEKAVRINAVGSGLDLDDLNVVLRSSRLQAIVIPKVQTPKDIQFVSRMIDSVATDTTKSAIRLIASIESALGIMNIKEIATSDPRLDALIFAAEDYCADLGLIRTSSRKELAYARHVIVTAASAYDLQAIDLVCLDYNDDTILTEECREGREMGFVGKQAIHPRQVDIIQQTFLPDDKDISRAARIIQGFKHHTDKGIGTFSLDGKMIDLPMLKWAEKIIARAKAGGVTIPTPPPIENDNTSRYINGRTTGYIIVGPKGLLQQDNSVTESDVVRTTDAFRRSPIPEWAMCEDIGSLVSILSVQNTGAFRRSPIPEW